MKESQKPNRVTLNSIIDRLRDGRYVIPNFQRDFEWDPWDINKLMSSIFCDYFIGSLLLWTGKEENFYALSCENIYGFNGEDSRNDIVLDGQQRLTAMYYAFLAPDIPLPNRSNRFLYFINVDRFMDEDYENAFIYDWRRSGINLLNDRIKQFDQHMFPLAIVGKQGWELYNWVQGYIEHWNDTNNSLNEVQTESASRYEANAKKFGEHLRDITEKYEISYIELDRELELDKVCEIFTRINSRGVQLDVFDLLNALLIPKNIVLRQGLWREASTRLEFPATERMNIYVLQVMSILRQQYCSPKYLYNLIPGNQRKIRGSSGELLTDVLIADSTDFKDLWQEAVEALEHAINLLRNPQEFGAISSKYLPYTSILPPFAALQAQAKLLPANQRLDAGHKIKRWYWASIFTNSYSGSVESRSARDYTNVKAWFTDHSAEPSVISEFQRSVRDIDLKHETKRGTSIYNGIFNLLVLNGARDWISGTAPQQGDLDDHHIVPKSLGSQYGLDTSIDTILNRTPLTAGTNRNVIRNRLPNEYLPELIKANGEGKIKEIMQSHFISDKAFKLLIKDPFKAEDFESFIEEREQTLRDGIEQMASHNWISQDTP